MSTKQMQPERYNGRFDWTYLSQLAESTTAEETVHFIYENIVDFENFLSSKPTQTKCFLVIKIAVKIKDTLPLQKRNVIYSKINNRFFFDNLTKFTSDFKSDKRYQSSCRECINNLNILLANSIDRSQLQIYIDSMKYVMLASENISKVVPSMTDSSKKIEKSRQKLHDSHESIKPEQGSRGNYRTVSLYPSAEDFERKNYDCFKSLSRNIIEGSYKDVEHYLNVQFHLLREDFIFPLRAGINSYKKLVDPSQRGPRERDSGVHIYKGVKVLSVDCGREQTGEISYRVQLDKKYSNPIRWEITKRLLFGSLVMFSNDDFKRFQLAVITDRDVNSLRNGFLSVKLVGRNVYGSKIHRNQYVMAESDAFFEPVYQTLKILQSIKSLPMEKYFLVHDVSPRRPSYMRSGSVIQLGYHTITLNNDTTWPDHKGLNMNESQYAALKASLQQKFVVVQGPPGTGKTFLALNITKTLLHSFRSVTPLLLLAYTNHALDQFIEGTLKFTKRVIRIGGQCQNKILDQFNLQKIKKQLLRNNNNRSRGKRNWYSRTGESGKEEQVYVNWPRMVDLSFPSGSKEELKQSYLEILVDTEVVRTIEDQLGLVNVPFFHQSMGVNYSTRIGNNEDFLVWLLGNSYENIKSLMKYVDEQGKSDEDNYEDEESSRKGNFLGYSDHMPLLTSEVKKELGGHICLTFEALEGVLTKLENRQNINNADHIRFLRSVIVNIRNGLNYNVQIKSYGDFDTYSAVELWSLPYQERWSLYNIWVERIRMDIMGKLEAKKTEHAQRSCQLKDIRTKEDLELFDELNPDIIGITTTGAARLHQLLSSLAPNIVIVEEAAQVLEAHIVSSLTTSCQHLILIGDHKQLKPNPITYELARSYGLDVSLFERMLNNGVCCKTLNVQHRMKPNIAALIAPSIYPDLTNHPSVSTYPPILGVSKNLFFIDHKIWEKKDLASESRCNPHEAEFMIALCRYLILQGYQASDIVILTTYSRQQFILRELQKKEKLLEDVRMTVVENYQGEECKIVLLSLVRSNREGNIGFLGEDNRICVALSRAKHGLYIIGNMQLLKTRSTLWKQINATLLAQRAIDSGLTLLCQVHDVETRVESGADFKLLEHAECWRTREVCPTLLPCGHYCSPLTQTSHADHLAYKCLQPCNRKVCTMFEHHDDPCPLPCCAPCAGCQVQVNRLLPQCGHIASMPCLKTPSEFICTKMVNLKLSCGLVLENVLCTYSQHVSKNATLPCGLTCNGSCGPNNPCGSCEGMINGVVCKNSDTLKEKRIDDQINMDSQRIFFKQMQLAAMKSEYADHNSARLLQEQQERHAEISRHQEQRPARQKSLRCIIS